jgi:hypothetical protein
MNDRFIPYMLVLHALLSLNYDILNVVGVQVVDKRIWKCTRGCSTATRSARNILSDSTCIYNRTYFVSFARLRERKTDFRHEVCQCRLPKGQTNALRRCGQLINV